MYKTVLVPNAPWPVYEKPIKKPRVRAKPSEVDAKFEAWLRRIK